MLAIILRNSLFVVGLIALGVLCWGSWKQDLWFAGPAFVVAAGVLCFLSCDSKRTMQLEAEKEGSLIYPIAR